MLQTHSNVSVPRSTSRGRATPARRRQRWYEACKISSLNHGGDSVAAYYARSPTTVGTTRDRPPPWVPREIAHHRGYYAGSPTTVGTKRDRPYRGYEAPQGATQRYGSTCPRAHSARISESLGNRTPRAHTTRAERSARPLVSRYEPKNKKTVGLHTHRSWGLGCVFS